MNKLLINCDLGEWEDAALTESLMPHLHMANIACGGHAGSAETINRCAEIAAENGVLTGAHPGIVSDRGRTLPPEFGLADFSRLLDQQIATYLSTGTHLHHIKLHGALYHLSESDSGIRQAFLKFATDQGCAIIALAGGCVADEAELNGLKCYEEAFLDRNYQTNGTLVPRTEAKASLDDLTDIETRLLDLSHGRPLRSIENTDIGITPDTVCIHSDSPNSLEIARIARQILDLR